MSRVLKSDGATQVHSLVSAWATPRLEADDAEVVPVDPELLLLRAEHERLKLRLEQQDAQLSDLQGLVQSAFAKGEAKGREAGLREAEDQSAQRLARLEAGIAQAQAVFTQTLESLERLAPALAHEGLASILGAADDRSQLVIAIIRKQLTTIETRSVIHVEVSAADFPDDEALDGLAGAFGAQGPVVHASVTLKSGECRIKLKLGALEVGIDQQWGRLGALLQDMAEPGERRS